MTDSERMIRAGALDTLRKHRRCVERLCTFKRNALETLRRIDEDERQRNDSAAELARQPNQGRVYGEPR